VDFVGLVFKLLLTWLEISPHYSQAYKDCMQSPYLFCVDLPSAISQCCYELVEVLGKLWGACKRSANNFAVFKDQYLVQGPFAKGDIVKNNGLVAALTNVFGEMQGFQKVVIAVKGSDSYQLPLSLVAILLSQFRNLPFYCDK
jgi:hypothetical protein